MSANLSAEQKSEIINYINAYRAIHQSGPLSYDNTLSEYSQEWASYLGGNNVFYNSGSKLYGESIDLLKGTEIVAVLKKAFPKAETINCKSCHEGKPPAVNAYGKAIKGVLDKSKDKKTLTEAQVVALCKKGCKPEGVK